MAASAQDSRILNVGLQPIMELLRAPVFAQTLNIEMKSENFTNTGVWYRFHHGVTFTSWGERITITLTMYDQYNTQIDVHSACGMPTQIIDWGKNKGNVNAVLDYIANNIAYYCSAGYASQPQQGYYQQPQQPQQQPQQPQQQPQQLQQQPQQLQQGYYQQQQPQQGYYQEQQYAQQQYAQQQYAQQQYAQQQYDQQQYAQQQYAQQQYAQQQYAQQQYAQQQYAQQQYAQQQYAQQQYAQQQYAQPQQGYYQEQQYAPIEEINVIEPQAEVAADGDAMIAANADTEDAAEVDVAVNEAEGGDQADSLADFKDGYLAFRDEKNAKSDAEAEK